MVGCFLVSVLVSVCVLVVQVVTSRITCFACIGWIVLFSAEVCSLLLSQSIPSPFCHGFVSGCFLVSRLELGFFRGVKRLQKA